MERRTKIKDMQIMRAYNRAFEKEMRFAGLVQILSFIGELAIIGWVLLISFKEKEPDFNLYAYSFFIVLMSTFFKWSNNPKFNNILKKEMQVISLIRILLLIGELMAIAWVLLISFKEKEPDFSLYIVLFLAIAGSAFFNWHTKKTFRQYQEILKITDKFKDPSTLNSDRMEFLTKDLIKKING